MQRDLLFIKKPKHFAVMSIVITEKNQHAATLFVVLSVAIIFDITGVPRIFTMKRIILHLVHLLLIDGWRRNKTKSGTGIVALL